MSPLSQIFVVCSLLLIPHSEVQPSYFELTFFRIWISGQFGFPLVRANVVELINEINESMKARGKILNMPHHIPRVIVRRSEHAGIDPLSGL